MQTSFRYVSNRWLSIVPVIERILDQWDVLCEYFLVYAPKELKPVTKTDNYKKIISVLRDNKTKSLLHFLVSIGSEYNRFLTLMQSDEPLVQILHDELCQLTRNLLIRFTSKDLYEGKHRPLNKFAN